MSEFNSDVIDEERNVYARPMVIIKRNLSPRKFSWNEMEREKKARVMARMRGMVGRGEVGGNQKAEE